MGNFYVNHTVRTPDQAAVAAVMRSSRRSAWLAPPMNGQVVVYDEASDGQDITLMRQLGRLLSRELDAPCLAILNHDDDVLVLELYEGGSLAEEVNSNPGFFGQASAGPRSAGARICKAWGVPGAAFRVAALLRRKFTFAVQLHEELAAAIGLADYGVGTGFRYVEQGELPSGLTAAQLMKVT